MIIPYNFREDQRTREERKSDFERIKSYKKHLQTCAKNKSKRKSKKKQK